MTENALPLIEVDFNDITVAGDVLVYPGTLIKAGIDLQVGVPLQITDPDDTPEIYTAHIVKVGPCRVHVRYLDPSAP